ncbi:MAG: amidohydrolase [Proteobacteria bacterium]|nr:amidohydrolase [Pseudomonadota bacterium]
MKSNHDTCVVNARVNTMDAQGSVQEAFSFRDGRILNVGTREAVLAGSPGAKVIDAKGASVFPGLIDCHAHLEMLAYAWGLAVDVRSSTVSSIAEMVERMRAHAEKTPPGEWILGHGQHFQNLKFKEGRFPDVHDLDKVSKKHPVVYRSSYHLNVFNSVALKVLRVDKWTPDAPGGRIEHDEETGELTGRTFDMYAPLQGPQSTVPSLVDAMVQVQEKYLSVGVTCIGEIPLHSHGLDGLLLMGAQGWGTLRAGIYPKYPTVVKETDFTTRMLQTRFKNINGEKMKLCGIKLFADGGLTSGAAALNEDYPGKQGYRGELTYSDDEMIRLCKAIDGAGFQIAIHAIGDRALDQALNAIATLPPKSREDKRHRIEHAGNMFMTPERIKQMADLHIVPVPQPAFILTTAVGYRTSLGTDRIGKLMPFRDLIDAGLIIPGNSDAIGITKDQHDPFPAIQATVARRTKAGEIVEEDQAVTVHEAFKMYTNWAAISLGWEDEMGSIEAGKVADFIMLDRNPYESPVSELEALKVTSTYIGGEQVYSA